MSKAPGASVLSGSINGASVLTITAGKRAVDSRYAKIMQVMQASEQSRPRLRRLGDQLGAVYTPVAAPRVFDPPEVHPPTRTRAGVGRVTRGSSGG